MNLTEGKSFQRPRGY